MYARRDMSLLRSVVIYMSVLVWCMPAASAQQVKPRHEGLASDSNYMELLRREAYLTAAADSLGAVISQRRKMLTEDPALREVCSADILRLESELFDMRNQLGMVATKTNMIEQEYVIKNMSSLSLPQPSVTGGDDFIDNNMTDEEKQAMRDALRADDLLASLGRPLREAVARQREIYERYKTVADRGEAAILDSLFEVESATIKRLDDSLAHFWQPVFDTKRYAYERLLDKLNTPGPVLEPAIERSRELRGSESEALVRYAAPSFAMYAPRRRLLLLYKSILAERLQSSVLYDAVHTALSEPLRRDYDYPLLRLPELVFVDFAPVVTGGDGAVSATNPPVPLVVPSRGELFKIELMTSSGKLTDYRLLRGVNNVEYREIAGGRFVYYAGSYRTREEAEHDSARLHRSGMKTKVAAWKNGLLVDEDGMEIEERPVGDIFRVIVYSMDDTARNIIKEIAPDKELLSIEEQEQTLVSVGPFEEYEKALFLAKSLPRAKVTGVKIDR